MLVNFNQLPAQPESNFRMRLGCHISSVHLASTPSPIFLGETMHIDPITAEYLQREQTLEIVIRHARELEGYLSYPEFKSLDTVGIGIDAPRSAFFRQRIYSPLVDAESIAQGQFAVRALAGLENVAKRRLYATLVRALSAASIDPYNFNCENSYRVLPDCINIFKRQLSVIRFLFSISAILSDLPSEASSVLRHWHSLAKEVNSTIAHPIVTALATARAPTSHPLNSKFTSWMPFTSIDQLALNLHRLIKPCTSKIPPPPMDVDYGVSRYGLYIDCWETLYDLKDCPFSEHTTLEKLQLTLAIEPIRALLADSHLSPTNASEWTPGDLAQLAPHVEGTFSKLEKFCEEAVCMVAPLLPKIDLRTTADEIAYLLGVAEVYEPTPNAYSYHQLSKTDQGDRPAMIFPTPLRDGTPTISLRCYLDRFLMDKNNSREVSPLSFSLRNGELSAIVGGDNGTSKTTSCLSVLRFFADAQSLLPVKAQMAEFIPRTSLTTFFVESSDLHDTSHQNSLRKRPYGSYDRFLERVQRVVYELLPNSDRPAVLFDDSIRAFTSSEAALELAWGLLEHFCSCGAISLFVQQDPALATMLQNSNPNEQWTKSVTVWAARREELAPGRYSYSLIPGSIPACSGISMSAFHGLSREQLATLREIGPTGRF